MKGIKKILFGIALILLGFFCMYVFSISDWGTGEVIGLIIPVVGIGFVIVGIIILVNILQNSINIFIKKRGGKWYNVNES